jgi:DNA-binding NtrC family response regulator
MATILIVDDEKNIRTHLGTYVRGLGHTVHVAQDGTEALALADAHALDVVLSDVRMTGMNGLALLTELRRRRPEAVVVLMTAYATVPGAVEAMRAGAYDYLAKPFALDEVGLLLDRVLEVKRLRHENKVLRDGMRPVRLESANARMRRVLETAGQAAASDVTVLLTGESGTGKNVLASAMHRWSGRAAGPFVAIQCTTLAEHLVESELFGHVKGAFTGAWKDKPGRLEAAGGGTVFLDEVGELAPELQGKLLRFLEAEVRAGRFREDLFFRLNVVALRLPALRDRPEDIPALIEHVLTTLATRHHRAGLRLAPEAERALLAYRWPGNVRELVNALERAVVLARRCNRARRPAGHDRRARARRRARRDRRPALARSERAARRAARARRVGDARRGGDAPRDQRHDALAEAEALEARLKITSSSGALSCHQRTTRACRRHHQPTAHVPIQTPARLPIVVTVTRLRAQSASWKNSPRSPQGEGRVATRPLPLRNYIQPQTLRALPATS